MSNLNATSELNLNPALSPEQIEDYVKTLDEKSKRKFAAWKSRHSKKMGDPEAVLFAYQKLIAALANDVQTPVAMPVAEESATSSKALVVEHTLPAQQAVQELAETPVAMPVAEESATSSKALVVEHTLPAQQVAQELAETPVAMPVAETIIAQTGTGPNESKVIPIRRPNPYVASVPVSATPVSATPVSATPVSATPVSATPVSATPVSATPVSATPDQPKISFAVPQRWVLGHQPEPEQPKATDQPPPPPSICPRAAAQAIICGIGVAVCTPSLVVLQALAGGSTMSAWYWSAITEIAALVLLIYPVRSKGFSWLWRSTALRLMGLAFLGLGYLVMHTSIAGTTSQGVATVVSDSSEVKDWEKEVARLEREIEPVQKSIEALNPVTHPSQIAKLKNSIAEPSKALTAARLKLSDARSQAKFGMSVDVIESWGLVEWLRRAGLMLLNTLSGHGLLAAMAVLTPSLFHRFRTRKI
jgi:hypothetical protein